MPTITFKTADGLETPIEGQVGYTAMEVGYNNGVEGLLAECGGAAACATCHVYVDQDWFRRTGTVEDMEDAMLFMANDRKTNSRLSCQIRITEELDGLVLTVADNVI